MEPVSDVLPGVKANVVMGEGQPQYIPLPALRSQTETGMVLTRWRLTDAERKALLEGADLFLLQSTFGYPFQPIQVEIHNPNSMETVVRYSSLLPQEELGGGVLQADMSVRRCCEHLREMDAYIEAVSVEGVIERFTNSEAAQAWVGDLPAELQATVKLQEGIVFYCNHLPLALLIMCRECAKVHSEEEHKLSLQNLFDIPATLREQLGGDEATKQAAPEQD